MSKDIIVVGGGVFGCAAALELQQRGYNVTIVEPTANQGANPWASSTDISKIVRSDYGADELYYGLNTESIKRWKKLNEFWGEELYHEVGLLNLSKGVMTKGSYPLESFHTLKNNGVAVERLDAKSITDRFSPFKPTVFTEGYYNPSAGWAESGLIVTKFLQEASKRGIKLIDDRMKSLIYDETCSSSDLNNKTVIGVLLESGKSIYASQIVVAVGAWTPTLLPWLMDIFIPSLQPVFHFRPNEKVAHKFDAKNGFPVFCADIALTGFYGFPLHPKEKVVKIGNHSLGHTMVGQLLTAENIEKKKREVMDKELVRFKKFIEEYIPDLKDAEVASFRLCLYEDTFDGDFLIDHDPHRKGLIVAAGGSGHGFKFGAVIGEVIADVVEKKSNKYASRFSWRQKTEKKFDVCRFVDQSASL